MSSVIDGTNPEPTNSRKRTALCLLWLALASGVGLTVPVIAGRPLVLDEHGSYWIAGADNPGTLLERSLDYSATLPVSFVIERAFLDAWGKSPIVFRASSVLCYLAAIALVYLFGKELRGPLVGGLAACVFAWHPEVIDNVRVARPYGATVMFAGLAFWLTARWWKRPDRLLLGLAWATANSLLVWTHLLNSLAVVPQLVALLVVKPRQFTADRRAAGGLLLALVLFGCSLLPLMPFVFRLWETRQVLNFAPSSAPWEKIPTLWWVGLPLGWLAGWLVSLVRQLPHDDERSPQVARDRRGMWMLAICALLPLIVATAASAATLLNLANERYQISYAIPAACLIAALLSYRRTVAASCFGLLTALAASWLAAGAAPWESQLNNQSAQDWKSIAEVVASEGRDGEALFVQGGLAESVLVLTSFEDPMLMDYIACRLGRFYLAGDHRRFALPPFWDLVRDGRRFSISEPQSYFAEMFLAIGASRTPSLWVASITDTDAGRAIERIELMLQRTGFREEAKHTFDSAVLMHYVHPHERDR